MPRKISAEQYKTIRNAGASVDLTGGPDTGIQIVRDLNGAQIAIAKFNGMKPTKYYDMRLP